MFLLCIVCMRMVENLAVIHFAVDVSAFQTEVESKTFLSLTSASRIKWKASNPTSLILVNSPANTPSWRHSTPCWSTSRLTWSMLCKTFSRWKCELTRFSSFHHLFPCCAVMTWYWQWRLLQAFNQDPTQGPLQDQHSKPNLEMFNHLGVDVKISFPVNVQVGYSLFNKFVGL